MQCMAVHCRQIRSSVTFSKALQAALLVSRRLKSGGVLIVYLKAPGQKAVAPDLQPRSAKEDSYGKTMMVLDGMEILLPS